MNLQDFVKQYDKSGAVILLEGKRKVADADKPKMIALGKILAENTSKMRFRSGNADGADFYFSAGVISVDSSRLEVITPYAGHRKQYNEAGKTYSLDDINLAAEDKVIYQTKSNKSHSRLVDSYLSDKSGALSAKAAYLLRDTIKVTGTKDMLLPASYAIFYDDLPHPAQGGTGHTMHICELNNVPFINQNQWLEWISGKY